MNLIKDVEEKKIIYDMSTLRSRMFKNLKPVLRFVSRYTSIVDGLCSVHPMPTALIWGGIKFLLKVVEDYTEFHDRLLGMLAELGGRFERLHLYVRVSDHERLNAAVLDACIHLLTLLSMLNGIFIHRGLNRRSVIIYY